MESINSSNSSKEEMEYKSTQNIHSEDLQGLGIINSLVFLYFK
jgi:hypothetical protein